ncbi:CueP family metal-binding protein [Demequina sediminicola]|uniref:CueP family metal-binding protein n=1 Tax=Demequina sediminicola TaxID=1095026 RepID=UPI000AFEC7B4|nr:CueP family metal-binding protein [Demequina sediminicola]
MTRITGAFTRPLVLVSATGILALALTACSAETASAPTSVPEATAATAQAESATATEILAAAGLSDMDAREAIDTLDALDKEDRPTELMASIRPNELVLTAGDGSEASLPMPEDEFYVSIAPYEDATHECYFHSLTTCTGEMQGAELDVLVTDTVTGEAVIDTAMQAYDNGFVGLWLPRDGSFTVSIEHDGKTATQELSTSEDDDATCVTTMQLS